MGTSTPVLLDKSAPFRTRHLLRMTTALGHFSTEIAGAHHGSQLKISSLHPVVLQVIFHQVGLLHPAFSWFLRIRATAQIFLTATHTTHVIHPSKCKVGVCLRANESCCRSVCVFPLTVAQTVEWWTPAKLWWNDSHGTCLLSHYFFRLYLIGLRNTSQDLEGNSDSSSHSAG